MEEQNIRQPIPTPEVPAKTSEQVHPPSTVEKPTEYVFTVIARQKKDAMRENSQPTKLDHYVATLGLFPQLKSGDTFTLPYIFDTAIEGEEAKKYQVIGVEEQIEGDQKILVLKTTDGKSLKINSLIDETVREIGEELQKPENADSQDPTIQFLRVYIESKKTGDQQIDQKLLTEAARGCGLLTSDDVLNLAETSGQFSSDEIRMLRGVSAPVPERTAPSPPSEKALELQKLLSASVVLNAEQAQRVLDIVGLPHSYEGILQATLSNSDSIQNAQIRLNALQTSLAGKPEEQQKEIAAQMMKIRREIEGLQEKTECLRTANEALTKSLGDNWDIVTSYYQSLESGDVKGTNAVDVLKSIQSGDVDKTIQTLVPKREGETEDSVAQRREKMKKYFNAAKKAGIYTGGFIGLLALFALLQAKKELQ